MGAGWLPRAPGSWGSLAAAGLAAPWFFAGHAIALVALAGAGSLIGAFVCARLPEIAQDPSWVVIDEWAGIWCALALAAALGASSFGAWLAAFVAFRVLDIAKPWPVSAAERWGAPWWGVMADDLVAGAIAGLMIGAGSPWLG